MPALNEQQSLMVDLQNLIDHMERIHDKYRLSQDTKIQISLITIEFISTLVQSTKGYISLA